MVLWANRHLLFWMGANHFERGPTILYGVNLLLCAVAYTVLQACLIRHQGPDSALAKAVSFDTKGKASMLLYVLGILAAWLIASWAGLALFVVVALIWLVPDRRIEKRIVG